MRYAIEFNFGDTVAIEYAGLHKGAMGWAPSLDTAQLYDTREEAERWLCNGYGAAKRYGRVIEVQD